jgi:uncharacterized protein YraI
MKTTLRAVVLLACVLALASGFSPTQAQEGDKLAFNTPVIVTLNSGVNVVKTFTVLENDRFELRLSRLADFTYSAALIDPAQAVMVLAVQPDGSAQLAVESVPIGGTYQLALQASTGSGDVVIQLTSTAVEPVPLTMGDFTANVGAEPQRFLLVPPPGTATQLNLNADSLANPAARLPGLMLADAKTGQTVLDLTPATLPRLTLTLLADTSYILALEPAAVPQPVFIRWLADTGAAAVSPGIPTPTPVTSAGVVTTGACQISLSGAVNIRPGPGTEYDPPVAQAGAGTVLPVTGHNGGFNWFQVNYNGVVGWVSGEISAVQLQGNCTTLPTASYPPPPVTAPVNPNAPSATPTQPGAPTATQPGAPTQPPLPTATTAPQVAPPDSNYSMAVALDGTAVVSDYVSYPGGDVEDVVGYSVTGLNPNVAFSGGQADLSIQLICQGTGTEYIVFRIDGVNFNCGQVFTRRVNADSNTGAVRITATGGTATYVQWTLQAQAPRVN